MSEKTLPAPHRSPPLCGPLQAAVPLTGWGRTAPTPAVLTPVHDEDEARLVLKAAGDRGVVARGLARSYGDAAQNAGGHVLDMTTADRVLHADLETGLVDVEAGISLDRLMNEFVPQGFFVPVTAGTRYVTVGGAIAADIHGKNHHVAGSFSQHVRWLDLLTADGQVRRVGPEEDPELFWATAGGMGLTGVILRAQVQMKAIESSRCLVDTDRTPDLDSLMSLLAETDHLYEYSVAWIDTLAKGKRMGRSVVTRGRFATLDELPAKRRADPLKYHGSVKLSAPAVFPPRLVKPPPPRRLPAAAAQPRHRRGVQRALVPQGAQGQAGPAAEHPDVLPPAGLGRRLEPHLRPPWLRAVPVHRALRSGGGHAGGPGAAQQLRDGVLPRRAQAVRPGQPRHAVLPVAGLDPRARHPGDEGPGHAAGPARRA